MFVLILINNIDMKKYILIAITLVLSFSMSAQSEEECEVRNVENEIIKPKFLDLINHLMGLINTNNSALIVDGYNPPELQALAPYLEATNLGIHNFNPSAGNGGSMSFKITSNGTTIIIKTTTLQIVDFIHTNATNNNIYHYYTTILSNGQTIDEGILRLEEKFCACNDCFSFKLKKGGKYVVSGWVKENHTEQVYEYTNSSIELKFTDANDGEVATYDFLPSGNIIDGWQRIVAEFTVPTSTVFMHVNLKNQSSSLPSYFDDVRIHPFNGNMKSFVYDAETQRLMAEQDENNYSTFYEYDKEGVLVRIKKETEKGVYTIQESRTGSSKLTVNPEQ